MRQREAKNNMVVLINVFTVDPTNQQRLVELLPTSQTSQWRSAEDYQVMRQDPTPLPYLQEALTLAKFEPGMYEVIQTFVSEY